MEAVEEPDAVGEAANLSELRLGESHQVGAAKVVEGTREEGKPVCH